MFRKKLMSSMAALAVLSTVFVGSPAEAAAPRRTVFSHSGYGDWTSNLKNVKTDRSLRVKIRVVCDYASDFNFVNVSWNGYPTFDYDYNWTDLRRKRSKTTYLYPNVRRGYLDVATQSDCWVSVKATQRR